MGEVTLGELCSLADVPPGVGVVTIRGHGSRLVMVTTLVLVWLLVLFSVYTVDTGNRVWTEGRRVT